MLITYRQQMRLKVGGIKVELLAHIAIDHGPQILQFLLAHQILNDIHILLGQTLVLLQKVVRLMGGILRDVVARLRRFVGHTQLWMHQNRNRCLSM